MNSIRFLGPLLLAASLLWSLSGALAQTQAAEKPYAPQPYQEGKDVIWLPTPPGLIEKMLDMGQVTARDFVIDLGSGDGRTVIAAAKRGARALGIEYNPDMVEFSNRAAHKEGVAGKVRFMKADLFETDFSEATVVTMYLLSSINLKLRPKILDLKPGTRIVSHAFDMGDWKPDRTESSLGPTAYLWIVPAKAAGTWQLPQGELTLRQQYQMIEGELKSGERSEPITSGRLRGEQLSFRAGGAVYTGRVSGNRIDGSVKSGGKATGWNATLSTNNPVSSPKN